MTNSHRSILVTEIDNRDNKWIINPDKLLNESEYGTWQHLMCMAYTANERSLAIFEKKVLLSQENEHTVAKKPDGTNVSGARNCIKAVKAMKAVLKKIS